MKKVLLGILTTIVIIGILIVGKIKIDDYRVKNIVYSE